MANGAATWHVEGVRGRVWVSTKRSAWVYLTPGALAAAAMLALRPEGWGALVFGVVVAFVVAILSGRTRPATVDGRGVTVGGALRVPRLLVDRLEATPLVGDEATRYGAAPFWVSLGRWAGDEALIFEHEEDARAAIAQLEAAREPTVQARFAPTPPWRTWIACAAFAALFAAIAVSHAGSPRWAAWVVVASTALLALASGGYVTQVRVSPTTLAVRDTEGTRTVPVASIARWALRGDAGRRAIVVRLRDGRRFVFREAKDEWPDPGEERAIDAFARALATWAPRAPADGTPDVDALRRGGRSIGEWIASLSSVRARGGGYRVAPLDEEALWRVVGDAACPGDARVGAAFVLARGGHDEARSRLRVAADAIAEPDVRRVLEAIAADPEQAERALTRVRDE